MTGKTKYRTTIALILILVLCMTCSQVFAQSSGNSISVNVKAVYGQTEARTMLKMINDFRTGPDAWAWNTNNTQKVSYSGLKPLDYDYDLEKVAMQRAAEIALSFSHTRPNGERCFSAYAEQGIVRISAAGENIAIGYGTYDTAASVFNGWKETDEDYSGQGHRRNMLSSAFTAVGIGHAVCGGVHCWVQNFQSPSINTSTTKAVNIEKTIPVEVLKASIAKISVTANKKICKVPYGGSAALPRITTTIRLKNTWGGAVSLSTPVQWEIAGKEYAELSGNSIIGKKLGQTQLTATVEVNGARTVVIPLEITVPAPKKVTAVKAAAGKKQIRMSWKQDANASGYQVIYAQDKQFKKAKKSIIVKGSKSAKTTIKGLKAKKTYYVKVRAYKTAGGKNIYGPYSSAVKAKVK